MAHAGVDQPVAQIRFAGGDLLLQFMDCASGWRVTFAPLRTGRVQIENCQTRVAAFRFTCREKTAAVSKRQQIANQCGVPGAIGDACRQDLVEQKAARRRQQPRTHIALFRQSLARRPRPRIDNVAAVMAEALSAEIIGDALFGDQLQPLLNRVFVAIELSQAQGEAISRMRTTLQLALVARGLEDLQRVVFRRRQIRVGLAGNCTLNHCRVRA